MADLLQNTDRGLYCPAADFYVDAFIRAHITGKFGPVRSVKPELVFELAFEGIQESSRHKSGVAVRFPRIHRRRTDKTAKEADTLEALRRLAGLQPS